MADDTADEPREECPSDNPDEPVADPAGEVTEESPAGEPEQPAAEPAAESEELANLSAQLDAVLSEPDEASPPDEPEPPEGELGEGPEAFDLADQRLDQSAIDALLSASGRVPATNEGVGRSGLLSAPRGAGISTQRIGDLDLLSDVVLLISAEIGRTEMSIDDVLKIRPGTLIELDKLAGEPVELFVGDRCIARGEVVVVDDSFGVRITELGPPS